jgi:eukaryotic-like serine/threonine-protein kinase
MKDLDRLMRTGGALLTATAEAAARAHGALRLPQIHERIGAYRILKLIGQGGMGAVFLAERADGEFERHVALKWLQVSDLSGRARELFRNERQMLAGLRHKNIAQLMDGGTTEDGYTWFAMELVDGETIEKHARRHHASINERLGLLLQVTQAVQFAHSRLLIHRDIKPSNVLVTTEGDVKLLDFGIAINSEAQAQAPVGFTLNFASPEQINNGPITTASDVYQLGLLLARLLIDGDRDQEIAQIATRIAGDLEGSGQTTDSVVGATPDHAALIALVQPAALRAIVAKAMAPTPALRYQSAAHLSADIMAYMQKRPIAAVGESWLYRMRCWVRRERVASSLLLASMALLSLAVAVFTHSLTKERDLALESAARANAANQFMTSLFEVADPGQNQGQKITVANVLQLGTARLRDDSSLTAGDRAALQETLSAVHASLGNWQVALDLINAAQKISSNDALVSARQCELKSRILTGLGERDAAVASVDQGLRALALKPSAIELHAALLNAKAQAQSRFGQPNQALQTLALLQPWLAKLPTSNVQIGLGALNRAIALEQQGNVSAALQSADWARQNYSASLGPKHYRTLSAAAFYGYLLMLQKRLPEAERSLTATLQGLREVLPENNQRTAYAEGNLALVKLRLGQAAAAEQLAQVAVAHCLAALGPAHLQCAIAQHILADVFEAKKEWAQAEVIRRQVLRIREQALPPDHLYVLYSKYKLAANLCLQDQRDAAAALLAQLPADHSQFIDQDDSQQFIQISQRCDGKASAVNSGQPKANSAESAHE